MSWGKSSSGTAWMPNQAAVLKVYVVIASIVACRWIFNERVSVYLEDVSISSFERVVMFLLSAESANGFQPYETRRLGG